MKLHETFYVIDKVKEINIIGLVRKTKGNDEIVNLHCCNDHKKPCSNLCSQFDIEQDNPQSDLYFRTCGYIYINIKEWNP